MIFNTIQVFPEYVIDYVVDTTKEQQSKAPICQNCAKNPPELARLYCKTENYYFCSECDINYHSSKLSSQHERVNISDKPKNFGTCQKHEGTKLELYCNVCSEALCVTCKIGGSHTLGEMAEHNLIKLKDAYS